MENARFILVRLLNVIGGIIGIFLGLRIILRFFYANPATPIVSWIYSVSDGLVYPFRGIFGDFNLGGIVDSSAFIALIAYAIILSILIAIVNAIFNPIIVHQDTHAHIH